MLCSHWLAKDNVSITCFPIGWRVDAYITVLDRGSEGEPHTEQTIGFNLTRP